ncbi:MAG: AraC family transcriptional regulator [Balneolaceae bacterium]
MPGIGSHLRQLRRHRGFSPGDVAAFMDTDPAHLKRIENGQKYPEKNQLFQLAGFFNADVNRLLAEYQKEKIATEMQLDNQPDKRVQNMRHELSLLLEKQVNVRAFKPTGPLQPYIESIQYCNGHHLGYSKETILPDGSVQLIIELDGQERRLWKDKHGRCRHSLKNAWVSGVLKQQLSYQTVQNETALCIRFKPGGFHTLTKIPQTDLKNSVVEAELIFNCSILELRNEILAAKSIHEIVQKTMNFFLERVTPPDLSHSVTCFMNSRIHESISQLAHKTGYSQKHLIHLFKKHMGVTPKFFQRIRRFTAVVNYIQTTTGKINWPDIAYRYGFYDQAHFIKEFRSFSGMSPREYLETGSTCPRIMYSDESR